MNGYHTNDTGTNGRITSVLYPDSANKRSFEDGMEFQDWIVRQFNKAGFYIQLNTSRLYQYAEGESVQRCEIKLDNGCTKYGRLSIEIAERTRNDPGRLWTPSGIYTNNDTVFYLQGNKDIAFLFDRKFLQRWWEFQRDEQGMKHAEFNGTIRKFYMSLDTAKEYSIMYIEPGE